MATSTGPKKPPKTPVAPSSGSGNRWFLLTILAVVILGAVVVAVAASGREDGLAGEIGTVEVEGDPIPFSSGDPGIADPTTDAATGLVAPTLTGTSFDDSEVTIGADGRAKAVYFLAHWCSHCQEEVPTVQALIDAGRVPEGLDIYAVATSTVAGRANFPPSQWLEEEGFTPVTMRDTEDGDALLAYGGSSFPYVVYLDSDNQLVGRSRGSLSDDQIVTLWNAAASAGT
ncbi:MAG: TlpA family protein disulfide reductase [Actinomycetia bacterium]|nr:TlpA family protein disulfide reductase [Actinomycetes bacterium]